MQRDDDDHGIITMCSYNTHRYFTLFQPHSVSGGKIRHILAVQLQADEKSTILWWNAQMWRSSENRWKIVSAYQARTNEQQFLLLYIIAGILYRSLANRIKHSCVQYNKIFSISSCENLFFVIMCWFVIIFFYRPTHKLNTIFILTCLAFFYF